MYFTLKNLSSLINSQSIPALHFTNAHSRNLSTMLPFNQHDVRKPFQSAFENPRSVIHKYIYILVPTRSTQLPTLPYHQSIIALGKVHVLPAHDVQSPIKIKKKSNLIPGMAGAKVFCLRYWLPSVLKSMYSTIKLDSRLGLAKRAIDFIS